MQYGLSSQLEPKYRWIHNVASYIYSMIGEANNRNTLVPEDSQEQVMCLENADEVSHSPLLPHSWMQVNNQAWLPYNHGKGMKQEEHSQKQPQSEQNELYRTRENEQHIMQLQYQSLFDNLKQEHDVHFNPPPERNNIQTRRINCSRPRRIYPRTTNQNLKGVAKHIRSLVANNPNLTAKKLGFVLFEIMAETRLGVEIVDDNYPTLEDSLLDALGQKYRNEQYDSHQLSYIIKNTRRRLYDAINVLIASSVIYRIKHSQFLRLTLRQPKKVKQELQQSSHQNYEILFEEFNEAEKRVAAKRRLLLALKKKKMLGDQLIARNQAKTAGILRFQLPLVVIVSQSKMLAEVEMNKVSITSESQFEILDDMRCLERTIDHRRHLSHKKPKKR